MNDINLKYYIKNIYTENINIKNFEKNTIKTAKLVIYLISKFFALRSA